MNFGVAKVMIKTTLKFINKLMIILSFPLWKINMIVIKDEYIQTVYLKFKQQKKMIRI